MTFWQVNHWKKIYNLSCMIEKTVLIVIGHPECTYLYFLSRCRTSIEFSIKCAWFLSAYSADVLKPSWKNSQGVKLKNMILNEELR